MFKVTNLRCEYKENPIGIDVSQPRLSWQLVSEGRGVMQAGYRIQVSEDNRFENIIWDTGMADSDQSIHVPYAGPALKPETRYYYRVSVKDNKGRTSDWSEIAYWETGLMDAEKWKASWISPAIKGDVLRESSPLLRKNFCVKGNVRKARIYATALGLYELFLNGKRIGDYLFTPGWTNYKKRLQYQTYDVTAILQPGSNAIGAVLGKGWYSGEIGWQSKNGYYGNRPAILLQLHITYEDGTEYIICSDESWKSAVSPIVMSEIYHGETYDARLEKEGWCLPDYSCEGWYGVNILDYSKDIIVAQENVPVRVIEKIRPIGVIKTPRGETVIDFGQNMTGRVRFKVSGPAGAKVVLKHAEVLDSEGNFYTENLRNARQTVTYILKGNGIEEFAPHFTFQGFRYVSVEEYPGDVETDNFTGEVIHSDLEVTGSFECSNELVNQLQHNILWGQKGNFLDVPTDCPQRDERLGWTGDAQMFIRTSCFNMNTAPFFTKWLRDLYSEQSLEKGVPFVVPNVLDENSFSSSAWGDAATICPWTIYLCFGDKRILEQQYDSMKLWVEYIKSQGENPYLWNTGFHYGDWLGLDSKPGSYVGATSKDLIATAFFAYSTKILVNTAKVLGKLEDAKAYGELYDNIVKNFREEFITSNGRIVSETQTAHVLVLMFDLAEEKDRARIAGRLAEMIRGNDCHLTTGFVGTPYLCHVLSKYGYNDLAYVLLQQTDYPSWLYQITKGATTIWEHWDGIKEDGTFWSRDMNSFNHYAYGSIGDWLYRVVAGIDTDQDRPGYKHIILRPRPENALSYAKACYKSMYGEIRSEWEYTSDGLKFTISVPCNTTATVMLPAASPDNVLEAGKPLDKAEGIKVTGLSGDTVVLELGSGVYEFTCRN